MCAECDHAVKARREAASALLAACEGRGLIRANLKSAFAPVEGLPPVLAGLVEQLEKGIAP